MMKSFKIAIAAVGLLSAAPVFAQVGPWNPTAFWNGAPENPYNRIQFLQDRVNRGVANGSLDRREAMRVNRELNGVRNWIQRMHWRDAGRLTPDQRGRVQARLDSISRQIHWMKRNGW